MTVPCGVATLLLEDRGKDGLFVLLGKRKGSHGAGEWALPGGRVHPGEGLKECAARELEEETGMYVWPEALGEWTPCLYNNSITGDQPWVTIFFYYYPMEV